MEKAFFFDAVVTDGTPDITYGSNDFAQEKKAYLTDGVLTQDGLKVSIGASFSVSLAKGAAVIDGRTYVNTTSRSLSLSTPNAAYDRIDLILIRLDLEARTMKAVVVTGEADAHPVCPECKNTSTVKEIPLAQIYVPCGAISLTSDSVTDVRTFSHFAPEENAKRAIVSEYLSALNTLTDEQAAGLEQLLSAVTFDGEAKSVLCADGAYRTPDSLRRVELVRYTAAGDYTFAPYSNPSEGDLYDIELIGGGGAGGCVGGEYCRGGGGGAGAYMTASKVRLSTGSYRVHVGEGGKGAAEADGGDGGETSFAGYYAVGGFGGKGGSGNNPSVDGGAGGESAGFRANSGKAGAIGVKNESIKTYAAGAGTFFGIGAANLSAEIDAQGSDAANAGCGGAGSGCAEGSGKCRGGNGADGCVIIYGYRRGLFADEGA